MSSNPNEPSNPTIITSKEHLLTKEAIIKGIWQAIKTKTNYDLALTLNSNKTGGIFVDSIWLKENYSINSENQEGIQNVIGKLISDSNSNSNSNSNNYISANLYISAAENKTSTNISLTSDQEKYLGIFNGTTLNRLPIADAKTILSKLIYEDAKLLSQYNKLMYSETIDDVKKQNLMLSGYDIITPPDNTIPSSTTVTIASTIYTYDNEQTPLTYKINLNDKTFTIPNTNCTYYPNTILIKIAKSPQRYTVLNNEITAIDGNELEIGSGTDLKKYYIPIDFEYVPEYTFERINKI